MKHSQKVHGEIQRFVAVENRLPSWVYAPHAWEFSDTTNAEAPRPKRDNQIERLKGEEIADVETYAWWGKPYLILGPPTSAASKSLSDDA